MSLRSDFSERKRAEVQRQKTTTMTPEQRIQDLEQGILRFITHLDDFRGNYEREELALLRKLVTIDRPYFPPVSYHDNWTGKETSTEND